MSEVANTLKSNLTEEQFKELVGKDLGPHEFSKIRSVLEHHPAFQGPTAIMDAASIFRIGGIQMFKDMISVVDKIRLFKKDIDEKRYFLDRAKQQLEDYVKEYKVKG